MKIENKQKEEAIIGIINDHILWYRIGNGMHKILNAFDLVNDNNEFEVDNHFNGIYNAFELIGIFKDDKICGKLSNIFYEKLESSLKTHELARLIYVDWLVTIREYYTNLKEVA
nr:hypothetical protein [uncultured Allomuricauda sp.]